MQNTPYQQFAKEFMELWQKQVASAVGDKQFIQAMLEMVRSIQPNHEPAQPATSQPADASGAQSQLLAELAFRLGLCEQRLAALEQQRKPAPGPRRGSKKSRD